MRSVTEFNEETEKETWESTIIHEFEFLNSFFYIPHKQNSQKGQRLDDVTEEQMEQLLDEVQTSQEDMKKMMGTSLFHFD